MYAVQLDKESLVLCEKRSFVKTAEFVIVILCDVNFNAPT